MEWPWLTDGYKVNWVTGNHNMDSMLRYHYLSNGHHTNWKCEPKWPFRTTPFDSNLWICSQRVTTA